MSYIKDAVIGFIVNQSDNKTAVTSGIITCNVYGLLLFETMHAEMLSMGFKVVGAILCSGLGAFTGLLVKHYFDRFFKKK